MKTKKLGDIILFPVGVVLFVGVSTACLVSYFILRIVGSR